VIAKRGHYFIQQGQGGTMQNKKIMSIISGLVSILMAAPNKRFYGAYCLLLISPVGIAENITSVNVQGGANDATVKISWKVSDQWWYAIADKDSYMGDDIPLISVSLATGNEEFIQSLDNCYFRGTLADQDFNPLENTNAYIDLCNDNDEVPFTGFVSNLNYVYTITVQPDSDTGISMQIDNPDQDLIGDDSVKNTGPKGANNDKSPPEQLYPRNAHADLFPSLEILVEPNYVAKVGQDAYLSRIHENLAFANFIYQQSGLKQLNLIAITLLDENIVTTGSTGNIRHEIQNLRRHTAQADSADMTLLFVGADINTSYTWGWAEDGYACDLQRAVELGKDINTINIGKSSGFVIDLPSLIQRGWILAHEIGHVLNSGHIKNDPLMDGWFQYIAALPNYVAGCDVKTQMYRSCAFNNKNKNFNDFYECN
jgi:hypothetical protein